MSRRIARVVFILAFFWTLVPTANAEQSQDFGDVVIHFNAFTTDILQSNVAKAYGIVRSKNRGLLNVSVLKKVMGTTGTPMTATVTAQATNLSEQLTTFDMREVNEQGAIYYIGEFPVSNGTELRFKINVRPQGSDKTHSITFTQEFFSSQL